MIVAFRSLPADLQETLLALSRGETKPGFRFLPTGGHGWVILWILASTVVLAGFALNLYRTEGIPDGLIAEYLRYFLGSSFVLAWGLTALRRLKRARLKPGVVLAPDRLLITRHEDEDVEFLALRRVGSASYAPPNLLFTVEAGELVTIRARDHQAARDFVSAFEAAQPGAPEAAEISGTRSSPVMSLVLRWTGRAVLAAIIAILTTQLLLAADLVRTERRLWAATQSRKDPAAYRQYIDWSDSLAGETWNRPALALLFTDATPRRAALDREYAEVLGEAAVAGKNIEELRRYLERFPFGARAAQVRAALEEVHKTNETDCASRAILNGAPSELVEILRRILRFQAAHEPRLMTVWFYLQGGVDPPADSRPLFEETSLNEREARCADSVAARIRDGVGQGVFRIERSKAKEHNDGPIIAVTYRVAESSRTYVLDDPGKSSYAAIEVRFTLTVCVPAHADKSAHWLGGNPRTATLPQTFGIEWTKYLDKPESQSPSASKVYGYMVARAFDALIEEIERALGLRSR